MERTLILIKPDGVQRRLVGEVIRRFEARGLHIAGLKLVRVTPELADRHYAEHVEKAWYPRLRSFVTSAPVVAVAVAGKDAIAVCRAMAGPTDAAQAPPGTIRGDLGLSKSHNVVHSSDGPDAAARELGLWFSSDELMDHQPADLGWVYDLNEDLG
jgi:nucleoside-diphosphate kinase